MELHDIITDQNIEDMLDAAGCGIAHWADKAKVDREAKTYWIHLPEDPIQDGASELTLSFDAVREAFAKLMDVRQKYVNDEIHGYFLLAVVHRDEDGIDAGHIDAIAADVLVQVAAWDEVIFG